LEQRTTLWAFGIWWGIVEICPWAFGPYRISDLIPKAHVYVRGGGKFSPTLLVERELEWFIRVSLPHALERMRREEALARSSSSAARLGATRRDATRD